MALKIDCALERFKEHGNRVTRGKLQDLHLQQFAEVCSEVFLRGFDWGFFLLGDRQAQVPMVWLLIYIRYW